jgi:hypothetical protein
VPLILSLDIRCRLVFCFMHCKVHPHESSLVFTEWEQTWTFCRTETFLAAAGNQTMMIINLKPVAQLLFGLF